MVLDGRLFSWSGAKGLLGRKVRNRKRIEKDGQKIDVEEW